MSNTQDINAWKIMERHQSGYRVRDDEISILVNNMANGSKEEMITYCLLHSIEKSDYADKNPGKRLSYSKSFKAINSKHKIKQKIDYFRRIIKAGEVSRLLNFKIGEHLEYTLRPLADLYKKVPNKSLIDCWNDITANRKGSGIKNKHVAKAAKSVSIKFQDQKKQRQLSAKEVKKKNRAVRLKKINRLLRDHPELIKSTLERLRIDVEHLP